MEFNILVVLANAMKIKNMNDLLFLVITWDVEPNIIPGWELPRWYGLMWALGIALSYQLLEFIYKQEEKNLQKLQTLVIYLLVGIFLGARLGHVLFYEPEYFLAHPIEILPIKLEPSFHFTGLAGLASHGGVIGVFIALLLFSRKYKVRKLWLLDRLAIVGSLCGGFIRLGNLFNSEILGIPTQASWAFIFTSYDANPRHPAQLYEAIFCFILFMLLFYCWKVFRKKWEEGTFFAWLLILLFSFRFLIEFLKIDQVAFESRLYFNMGQLLSIPFILLGILILIKNKAHLIKLAKP